MAGYLRYTAVLDACVLYPAPLRDLLLTVSAHGIEVLHPDDFLIAQYDLHPIKVLAIVKVLRARLRKPPKSTDELIATYEQQGLAQFCEKLRQANGLI